MSEKAIEILIRLKAAQAEKDLTSMADAAKRADKSIGGVDRESVKAERALKQLADGARQSEQGMKAAERGVNKMRSAVGGSSLANDLDDVAEGIEAIGLGGAAATVGLGLLTTASAKLGTEMIAIMRDVDALAPKFEAIAGTEIISQASIDSSHTFSAALDRLYTQTSAIVGVIVDFWAPAFATVADGMSNAEGAALRLYKILEQITKSTIAGDLEGIGAALFGDKYDSRKANPTSGSSGGGYTIGPMGRMGDPVGGDFSSLMAGAAKIKKPTAAPPAPTTIAGRPQSAAQKYAVSGPSSAGMAQIDVSDIVGPGLVELTRDVSAWAVEIDLSDEYIADATDSMTALNTTLAETTKAAKAAKLNSIAGGLGTAQSILSSGTAGIANAVSSTGPAGAVVGAVMSLGDTLATMGTEGIQTMIDGVLSMPVTVLEMLPDILTETIPNLLSEGIPDLVSGIILALPEIVMALANLVPILVEAMVMELVNLVKDLIVGFKDALNPFNDKGKSKAFGGGKAFSGYDDLLHGLGINVGSFRKGRGGDAFVAPSTGPRQGGGSTARTAAPDSGGGEQHVHVHVGHFIGGDANGARGLARLLDQHRGTRGTGL